MDPPELNISTNPGKRHGGSENASTQDRHSDRNDRGISRATLNFTLYTASILPWIWRLTPSGTVERSWAVDLPLEVGGCIILGDKARRGRFGYQTVDHEVLSPPSSHRGDDVKRIRLLAYD